MSRLIWNFNSHNGRDVTNLSLLGEKNFTNATSDQYSTFKAFFIAASKIVIRGGVLEDIQYFEVLGLGLKSLALASKPQVLENCPVLGSRTALFFESLKFCWKTPETSRKIFEYLFCFPQLEHRRSQRGEGGRGNPPPN